MANTGRASVHRRAAAARGEDGHAAHNRQQQADIYGEPLGGLIRRVGEGLGLTQARIAGLLGVSQPMLSQLVNAQRVKIGNPAAVQRLQELVALAGEVDSGRTARAAVAARLADIAGRSGVVTGTTTSTTVVSPAVAARTIQGLFRAVAAAPDLLDAAASIDERHPEIADLLRVYGTGRTQDAIAHFGSYAHLI